MEAYTAGLPRTLRQTDCLLPVKGALAWDNLYEMWGEGGGGVGGGGGG